MSDKLTQAQALILTGFTGVVCVNKFSEFHADVEKRLGRSVRMHEFASKGFDKELEEVYRADFMALLPEASK